ncbi:very short patch repair endonuclease [Bradyrhizobium liaoningense]
MRSIRKAHTGPERAVRRLIRELGLGYRLYAKDLPGNPDVVLRKLRRVVFVHGCFWHQHPGCRLAKQPTARPEYWLPKFARTQERDRAALMALERMGWSALVIWECELDDLSKLRMKLKQFLGVAR